MWPRQQASSVGVDGRGGRLTGRCSSWRRSLRRRWRRCEHRPGRDRGRGGGGGWDYLVGGGFLERDTGASGLAVGGMRGTAGGDGEKVAEATRETPSQEVGGTASGVGRARVVRFGRSWLRQIRGTWLLARRTYGQMGVTVLLLTRTPTSSVHIGTRC